MVQNINQCKFKGRLGADPEVRRTESGKYVSSFSLAISENRKNKDTDKWETIHTEWVRIVCWADLSHFKKGDIIEVEGTLKTRKYKDKQGNDKSITEVIVWKDNVICEENPKEEPKEEPKDDYHDDDIPF